MTRRPAWTLSIDAGELPLPERDARDLIARAGRKTWGIRIEPPLEGPSHVVDYLSRYVQHVLPDRFVRIRHYGLLASRRRPDLERCREQLGGRTPPTVPKEPWDAAFRRLFGSDPLLCPRCQVGRFVVREVLPPLRL